jgi:hypothetical protein
MYTVTSADKEVGAQATTAAPDTEKDELLKRIEALEAEKKAEHDRAEAAEKEAKALEKKLKKDEAVAAAAQAAEPPKDANDYLEERITVNLFYDGEKYKDDVDISVNGERILIQRGKDVQIKRKHALVLQQSMKQDDFARAIIKQFIEEYAAKEKALS